MQGVVIVEPLQDRSPELNVTVAGFQAVRYQGTNVLCTVPLISQVGFIPLNPIGELIQIS